MRYAVVVAALAGVIAIVLPGTAFAGRLVYSARSCEQGPCNSALWVMNDDGTARHRLPIEARGLYMASVAFPSWSPDGGKISYLNGPGYEPGVAEPSKPGLWLANADGSGAHSIVEGFLGIETDWSPDGSGIVFNAIGEYAKPPPYTEWDGDIFLWSPSGVRPVLSTPGDEYAEGFAEDGRVIFRRNRYPLFKPAGRYAIDPVTGRETLLALSGYPETEPPLIRFSPDGRWVAILNGTSLTLASASGTQTVRPVGTEFVYHHMPKWSRDSQSLYFVRRTPGDGSPNSGPYAEVLSRYDLASGQVRSLTPPSEDAGPMDWTDGAGRVPSNPDRLPPTVLLLDDSGDVVTSRSVQRKGTIPRSVRRRKTRLLVLDNTGIKRIDVAVAKSVRVGKRKVKRCRFARSSGHLGKPRSCKRPKYVRLRTSAGWRSFARHLKAGKYLLGFRTSDTQGNRTKRLRLHAVRLR